MKGYRTIVTSVISLVLGILTMSGVVISEETAQALRENAEAVVGGIITLYGLIMGILRLITDSPAGEK